MNALFEMYADRVFAYAFHLLGNREDAEEVTSEAFLRAFERAYSYRGECPLRGWLFGITRHLCLDCLRQPRLLLLEPQEAERRFRSAAGDSETLCEERGLVRRALAELPDEYRVILMLCDVEEWDAKEAAFALEKSLPATKSLLYRARRALRARLMELWDDADSR
jgi:RNA polymerase sigma-70 factor (ECF subfamily)